MCVCVREREREGKRESEREREGNRESEREGVRDKTYVVEFVHVICEVSVSYFVICSI